MEDAIAWCESGFADDNDKCCFDPATNTVSTKACNNWSGNSYTICRGSCRGDNACSYLTGSGNYYIGVDSCTGGYSCRQLNENVQSENANIVVKNGSCKGVAACNEFGSNSNGDITIDNSCNEEYLNACYSFALSSPKQQIAVHSRAYRYG